jgi:hypothetical protein
MNMNTALNQNPNMQDISANLSRLLATGTVKQEQINDLLSGFVSQIMSQVQNLVPTTPAVPHILEAMNAMQKEVSETGLSKDSEAVNTNGKTLYKFRGIDDVYNLISPLLARHGITLGVNCISKETTSAVVKNSILYSTTVKVEYSFISKIDSSKHVVTMFGDANDYGDKSTAKALSMAFKYACFQVLCIPVCDDPDGIVHDKIPANNYQPNQWTQNNAQSNQSSHHNHGQNNDHSYQHNGNNGQNNGYSNNHNGNKPQNHGNANHATGYSGHNQNHGQGNGQNNNGQNNNAQNNGHTINQQQANLLLGKLNAAGADPQVILKNHNIQNLTQLTIKIFEGLVKRLDTHLNEQQQLNQQNGGHNGHLYQGNYS